MGQARGWNWDLLTCIYFLLTGAATAATSPPIYLVFAVILLSLCFRRIQWVSRQGQEDGREGHVREAVHGRDGRSDAAKSPLGRQSEGETPATLGFFKISDISARKAEY